MYLSISLSLYIYIYTCMSITSGISSWARIPQRLLTGRPASCICTNVYMVVSCFREGGVHHIQATV